MAINRVTIMGNLTRDAELRKKGDATSVLTFGLAINEKKKDSETGEYVDAPVFVDCALFGARAEALAPYLTKGKKVSVDGRLRYHSWMKNEYLAWLEHKADRYTTVYGYMGLGDRYEQHLL